MSPDPIEKGKIMSTLHGNFAMISNNPKVWGVRVFGKGKVGATVTVTNRWGNQSTKVLVEKMGNLPANPYNGQPEAELWSFQNA
jgi:hypothetical protein